MSILLELVPVAAKVVAVAAIVARRPGRHTALLLLLVSTGVGDGVLQAWPGAWSVTGYIATNAVECACIALAAIDAVRQLRDRRLLLFQMACAVASTWVSGEILGILFPPDTIRTVMVRVHFAAAAVAGIAAGTRRLDPVDDAALRWLFVTRVVLCLRLPLIGTAAYPVLVGVSTVAWVVACYLIVHHCLSSPGDDAPALAPRPGLPPA